jgi:hypothetical protein
MDLIQISPYKFMCNICERIFNENEKQGPQPWVELDIVSDNTTTILKEK